MNRNFAVLARLALWGVRGVRDFRVWGLRGVKASSAFGCERFRDLGFGAMGLSAVKALGFGVLGLWACLGGGGGGLARSDFESLKPRAPPRFDTKPNA